MLHSTNGTTCFNIKISIFAYRRSIYILFFNFFIILSGVRLSPLGAAATTGLLYQRQVIDDGDFGTIGGMNIGKGNRSTWRNLPQCHFVHQKSHMTKPGFKPCPPRWKACD
jgi:hypothetical protein